MIKSLIPALSKEVGRSTALVFQQLMQWFKSNDVVYRTNQEIAEDLEGILSVTTVQRAKQKLIDAGYLSVSFDKGYKRTTHYRLTEKAKGLIQVWKEAATQKVEAVKKAVSTVFAPKKPKAPVSETKDTQTGLAGTKSMQEAFEDYGKSPKGAVAMPEALRNLVLGQKKSAPIKGTDTTTIAKPEVGSIFKKVVNEAQERLYNMKLQASTYNEDF